MFKIELHNRRPEGDPVPCFATSSEVAIAEELRHRLEKQLLAPSTPPAISPGSCGDCPEEAPGMRHRHGNEQS